MKEIIKSTNVYQTAVYISLLISTVLLFSCGGKPQKLYQGTERPSTEFATLTSFDPVRLLEIDGKFGPNNRYFGYSSSWNSKCVVELEPGSHELVFNTVSTTDHMYVRGNYLVNESKSTINDAIKLSFTFKPGKIYQIIRTGEIIEVKRIPSYRKPYDKKNVVN